MEWAYLAAAPLAVLGFYIGIWQHVNFDLPGPALFGTNFPVPPNPFGLYYFNSNAFLAGYWVLSLFNE